MKKIFTAFCTVAMLFFVTACGGGKQQATTTKPTTSTSQTTNSGTTTGTTTSGSSGVCDANFKEDTYLSFNGEQVRMQTWMRNHLDPFFPLAKKDELNEQKKQCITRSNEAHDTSIKWVSYKDQLSHSTEIINQHSTGEYEADLYNINSNYVNQLAEAGAIREIPEALINKYFPDYYFRVNKEIGSYKGKLYGIWPERNNVNMGIYINIDLLENAGLDNPAALWNDGEWNWTALESLAAEFKSAYPDKEFLGINNYQLASYLIGSNGGYTINPYTDEVVYDDSRAVNALTFAQNLHKNGYIYNANAEGQGLTDVEIRSKYINGELLMYFGSDWISGDATILKPGDSGIVKFNQGMVAMPVGSDVTDIESEYRLPITVSNLWVFRGNMTDAEIEKFLQYFSNITPWGDDDVADKRYENTMRDHLSDRDSLKAYCNASKYGYYEKTSLYGIEWAQAGTDQYGVGNVYAEIITKDVSVEGTLATYKNSIQGIINDILG